MKIFGSDTLISLMTKVIFHYLDVYTVIGTSCEGIMKSNFYCY